VTVDTRAGFALEVISRSQVQDLILEEVPDVDYSRIGGLGRQIEQLREAVELPFAHPELYREHGLRPPKGVLLYGPPGCGKTLIAKEMRKQNLPIQRLMTHESLVGFASDLNYQDISALYAAVGEEKVSAVSLIRKLVEALGGVTGNEEDMAEVSRPGLPASSRKRDGDPGILVEGLDDLLVKLAGCCTPVPGDEIVGFNTRGSGVSVHRADCGNVEALRGEPERIMDVEWSGEASTVFMAQIQVEALDRHRLLSDVTKVLAENHVNILSASVHTTKDRVALSRFQFEMAEPQHLNAILASVRRVDGVFDVYRITGAGTRRDRPPGTAPQT
jgi:GTP pyrophosphokinase